MKKTILMSLAMLMIVAYSCKKDKKEEVKPAKPNLSAVIVGDWKYESLTIDGEFTEDGIKSTVTGVGRDFTGKVTMKADKKITSTADGIIDLKIKVALFEIPVSESLKEFADFEGGSYNVISNTQLELTEDGEKRIFTVEEYTTNSMTLFIDDKIEENDGSYKLRIKFKK